MFDSLNFNKLKPSDAPRGSMALLLALTTAREPTAVPAFPVSKPVAKAAKA
jgi:hypothetical protein